MNKSNSVRLSDRLVSFLSYITVGWAGLIYLVILFFLKKSPSRFLRYNVLQSIFVAFSYFVICLVLGFVCDLLLHVPFLNALVSQIYLIFNKPVLYAYSAVQVFVIGLFIYMAAYSLLGLYPRIYWVSSKVIDHAAR